MDRPCKFAASEMMLAELSPWVELYQMMASDIVTKAGLGPIHYKRFKVSDHEIPILSRVGQAIHEGSEQKAAERRARGN